MKIFEATRIGPCILKNRIIRSATYEGMSDTSGYPQPNYKQLYTELAKNDIGGIITGFTYISEDGKAMQKHQAGIDSTEKASFYKEMTDEVHKYDCKIFMQIAHAGRQTRQKETGRQVWGVSDKKSIYFGEVPKPLTTEQVFAVIEQFATVALLVKKAGFDGIQLHGAHGYLIHQFLLPSINKRTDLFKPEFDTKIGTKFLELIIDKIKEKCGNYFPILIKVSGCDDELFINLIRFFERKKVDAIEVSYGTMDNAFNIIRGDLPIDLVLKYNPVYGTDNWIQKKLKNKFIFPLLRLKIKAFTPMYTLKYAKIAKQNTNIPVICVGGLRKGEELKHIIENENIDFVSLCRPFICEPDFVRKILRDENYISKCTNCNFCTVMCDSNEPTCCYRKGEKE